MEFLVIKDSHCYPLFTFLSWLIQMTSQFHIHTHIHPVVDMHISCCTQPRHMWKRFAKASQCIFFVPGSRSAEVCLCICLLVCRAAHASWRLSLNKEVQGSKNGSIFNPAMILLIQTAPLGPRLRWLDRGLNTLWGPPVLGVAHSVCEQHFAAPWWRCKQVEPHVDTELMLD